MRLLDSTRMIIFDLDGTLIYGRSALGKYIQIDSQLKLISRKIPGLKKTLFNFIEIFEPILKVRFEVDSLLSPLMQIISTKQKYSPLLIGVITDRSLYGIKTVTLNSKLTEVLSPLAFLQIRESFLNPYGYLLQKPSIVCFSDYIKPHKSILNFLNGFIQAKHIKPSEVMIIDDNECFRTIANEMGFQTFSSTTTIYKAIIKSYYLM